MAQETWAILNHYRNNLQDLKLGHCPFGPNSWCSYQRDLANGTNEYAQKIKFPLRISSVNVTKSAGNSGFGHTYWRNP